MSRATFFVRECPTCGRMLQIRVEYLGRLLVCEHCRGGFEATDPDQCATSRGSNGSYALNRAEKLLSEIQPPSLGRH